MQNNYSIKEILNETRVKVDQNNANFLALKEQYDTQSTAIYEKSKEQKTDLDGLGMKFGSLDKRVSRLELRVYAATIIMLGIGFIVQNFWK